MPPSASTDRPPGPAARTGAALFSVWRRLVSALLRGARSGGAAVRHAVARWQEQWPLAGGYFADPATAWVSERAPATAASLGVRAFIAGTLVTAAITAVAGAGGLAAGATVAIEVMWAVARFAIMALVTPQGLLPRRRLALAYAAGLAPFAFGVVAPARFVALAFSAWLTARGVRAAGLSARDTRIAIGWAFGGQVAVLAAAWLARGVLTVVALA